MVLKALVAKRVRSSFQLNAAEISVISAFLEPVIVEKSDAADLVCLHLSPSARFSHIL